MELLYIWTMRKLRADWIFDGHRMHQGATLVMDEAGVVADLLLQDETAPGDATEYFHGILCPGFVNAHCHLELSCLKGHVPKGRGLVDFILQLQRARSGFQQEEVVSAMEQAEREMLAAGIVGVGDIANGAVSFRVKEKSRLAYHTFLEVFGFDPAKAGGILSAAMSLRGAAVESGRGRLGEIVPHAPYSVSPELFGLIAACARSSKDGAKPVLLSIHNQESAHEDPFYREGSGDFNRLYRELGMDISYYRPHGSDALETWLPWMDGSGKILLVHNTYTRPRDIRHAAETEEIWWCLCPNANLYIENRLPDIPLFVNEGLRLVLGTDSLASNDGLSILEEMKTISAHFPTIDLEQLLQWATRNGAEFFEWEHLGSFSKGKRPGVNLLTGLHRGKYLSEDTRVRTIV